MTVLDAALLNNAIDFMAMACLAALLWAARSYVASIISSRGAASRISIFSTIPRIRQSPARQALPAILPISIILSRYGYLTRSAQTVFVGAGILLLGAAALLREPVGIMASSLTSVLLRSWLGDVPFGGNTSHYCLCLF